MNLYSLKVKGFRKLHDVEINFSDATFLIGENNAGKSSVIEALRHLLSAKDKIELDDFSAGDDDREIVIEANFHNLPEESVGWRGFAGRVIRYSESNESDTGLGFRYRKICGADGSPRIEAMQNDLKGEYKDFTTINDLLENGLAENDLPEELKDVDRDKKLAQKDRNTLLTYTPSIYGESAETTSWVENPGGIKQNVLSRLPMLVTIPAQGDNTDIQAQKGVLHDLLEVLFEDLKVESDAYKKAQQYLSEFSRLMDPMNEETSAHKMIDDINTILSRVFDGAKLNVETAFSGADSVKPSFNVTMSSNIATSVDKQGTGLTRAALFAILRYKANQDCEGGDGGRSVIIAFEEPELYLHPNAIRQMNDTLYDLAETVGNQIICTTHSPRMIDLSRDKGAQTLNWLSSALVNGCKYTKVTPLNVTSEFKKLADNDKSYVKMILRSDPDLAESFFVRNVLIVEGDTEQVVINETIALLDENSADKIRSNWYILRARGKAVITSLVKYLNAMGIHPYVMHDRDAGIAGAERFNNPIKSVCDEDKLFVLEECVEDVLGYNPPKSDKPYKAFEYINSNWHSYSDVSSKWKNVFEKIFINEV